MSFKVEASEAGIHNIKAISPSLVCLSHSYTVGALIHTFFGFLAKTVCDLLTAGPAVS